MFPAPILLVILIFATPVMLVFDGGLIDGMVFALAALSLAAVALRIHAEDSAFLGAVVRLTACVALLPALLMVAQVLPTQPLGLANPIWQSAGAALGRTLPGCITIDVGATLTSLARYLCMVGVACVAAAVSVDRRGARMILGALTAATTIIAALLLAARFAQLRLMDDFARRSAAIEGAVLGLVFAAAMALNAWERSKAGERARDGIALSLPATLMLCLGAIAICAVAVAANGLPQYYFAVALALATFVAVVVVRRGRMGPGGQLATAAIVLLGAVAGIAFQQPQHSADLTLAYAGGSPQSLMAVTGRILMETRWTGSGAGTFAALIPLHRDIREVITATEAPTAAAMLAIEMGRPFLWAALAAGAALALKLLRGAVWRGRDSSYATAGAACVVATAVLAFVNAGIFSMPVQVLIAAAIGVALAQSKSRRTAS